jgi:hypothetical protein
MRSGASDWGSWVSSGLDKTAFWFVSGDATALSAKISSAAFNSGRRGRESCPSWHPPIGAATWKTRRSRHTASPPRQWACGDHESTKVRKHDKDRIKMANPLRRSKIESPFLKRSGPVFQAKCCPAIFFVVSSFRRFVTDLHGSCFALLPSAERNFGTSQALLSKPQSALIASSEASPSAGGDRLAARHITPTFVEYVPPS